MCDDSTMYPVEDANRLDAGGGGKCTYWYNMHPSMIGNGRPIVNVAACSIHSADVGKGNATNNVTRTYAHTLGAHDGVEDDDAGHILAHNLGGCGTCPINIFPQSPHVNRGAWKEFEENIAKCLDVASQANLSWKFVYQSNNDWRPFAVKYLVQYHRGCDDTSTLFSNEGSTNGKNPTDSTRKKMRY